MAKKDREQPTEDILQDEFLDDTPTEATSEDWLGEDVEGQLAVDVYQTKDTVVIKAPIAGVKPDDIDISLTEDVLTLRGERKEEIVVDREHYYVQECYWGSFSRSVILPTATVSEKAQAALKDGVLTITIPKVVQDKIKKIKVTPQ